jgi:hypothetical protein
VHVLCVATGIVGTVVGVGPVVGVGVGPVVGVGLGPVVGVGLGVGAGAAPGLGGHALGCARRAFQVPRPISPVVWIPSSYWKRHTAVCVPRP